MKEKNKLSCEEHIDLALDDFLVENETFPILEKVGLGLQEDINKFCSYCDSIAIYILKKQKENE